MGSLIQAAIVTMNRASNNVKVNGIVQDFFYLVYTLSPKSCTFLKSNLGFRPSERYIRWLNKQEEKSSPFYYSFKQIYETMKT